VSRPQAFGAYDLLERINVGGMAEVFRAVHRQSRRLVAIKRILPSVAEDDEFISMFHDEAIIASQLDHPNIAKIFDIGKVDASYYIAFEYVNGRDMRTVIDNAEHRQASIPIDMTLHVIMSLCKGLDYAHRRVDANGQPLGLVHRDVSPPNILVSYDGDVKLIDFGIAKAAGKLARTQVGSIKGKFGYMSPEQVRGLPVDQRSDIFAIGICLWEFLTCRRLFLGDNEVVVMGRIRNAEAEPPSQFAPSLSPELDQMVMRALAKDVDERYTSASDLFADLNAFAQKAGITVSRDPVADYMRRTFPNDASLRVASHEEAHAMAENKGGSDLDVFEGLARKPQARPATTPSTVPSPLGVASSSGPPPPGRARTLLGMAPPMPPSAHGSMPSSPGRLPIPSSPGLPPPPVARGSGVLPAISAPPAKGSAPPPARGTLPSNPLPPPVAPPVMGSGVIGPPPAKPAAVDMDWDDEDEKTHVYDKQSTDEVADAIMQPLPAAGTPAPPPTSSAAAALLQRSGNVAPPMPKVPSIPPPTPGLVPAPPPRTVAAAEPTMLSAPKEKASSLPWILVAILVLVAGGLGAYFLMPSTGSLKVYVSGPGGRDIGKVNIFVNNEKVCSSSPCTVNDLKEGIHDVKAEAEGYEPTAPKGVEVKGRAQAKLDLELAVASAGSGFKVAGAQQGIMLFVDGSEVGPLPQTLKTLSPGEHKLRFVGSERFEPLEKTLTVVPDKIEDLGEIKLNVLKGKATLQLVTRGARILLVPSKGEKRQIDERMFKNDQLSIDIDTSKEWSIEATKPGYDDLKIPISFADGQAEKTFRIELHERGKTPVDDDRKQSSSTAPTSGPGPTPASTPTAATTGGPATLNINSIPPSAVLLDGRPIGRTPKSGVVVSPGTHSITFIHPEKGRKSTSVTVKAGETKGVGVRF